MKKIALLTLTGFLFLSLTSLGQEIYTGASQPENFQPKIQQYAPADGPVFSCLACALPEGEADIQNDGVDVTNGGCNITPPLFTDINIGDVYCGRTNTYSVGGNPNWRDTDWYRIVLTGTKTLYWSSIANCPLNIFIIQDDGNCGLASVVASDTDIPAGTTGQTSYTCGPGTWYFWVALPVFSGWASGADYQVVLSEGPPPDPWCSSGMVPLSNWAIYIGIFLIATFMVFRFRRRLA